MKRFKIAHVDPLGQGVSKTGDDIIFIRKTLPEESGLCEIKKSKKNVHFAIIESLENKSDIRISPECEHFKECPGCHYLHTDYDNELKFKEKALHKAFQKVLQENFQIQVVPAEQRLNYRNRMQVHYDKATNQLGFIDGLTDKIVEVPNCQLMETDLEVKWKNLFEKKFPKNSPKRGHVEISTESDSPIWNERYAHDGFTQVNAAMNEELRHIVTETVIRNHKFKEDEVILDLFGGNGNLSKNLDQETLVVDAFSSGTSRSSQSFLQHNLFKESLASFLEKTKLRNFPVMLIDPPRSGFKNIKDWTDFFRPQTIIYVSCFAAKQARDIEGLTETYRLDSLYLIDMFPGTHHYETIAVLKNNS